MTNNRKHLTYHTAFVPVRFITPSSVTINLPMLLAKGHAYSATVEFKTKGFYLCRYQWIALKVASCCSFDDKECDVVVLRSGAGEFADLLEGPGDNAGGALVSSLS